MALPKLENPLFVAEIPSTKKKIKYRPFTVKEEKILMFAMESNDPDQIQDAVKGVLSNCIQGNFDFDSMTTYDLEYLFLQLRSKSIGNVIELKIKDPEDEKYYEVEVDVDDIKVVFDKEHSNIIKLTDEVTLVMKDPDYKLVSTLDTTEGKEADTMFDSIISCIDQICVGEDEVLLMKDHTKQEQQDFVESFNAANMKQIEKFFTTLPKLSHTIKYKTAEGKIKEQEISGLQSFFS